MNLASPPPLRRARPGEAAAITELMLRSKRHWPYADAFMEVMVPAMTLSEDVLAREREVVDVLDDEGAIVGVVHLIRHVELAFLENLFVDPKVMGRGYGRLLFERAVGIGRGRGWGMGMLEFESDPFAEPFYLGLGAVRVGMSPSTIIPGRAVPLMRYALMDAPPGASGPARR